MVVVKEAEAEADKPAVVLENDEFIDETIGERLWGLTEMFPEIVRNSVGSLSMYTSHGGKKFFSFASSTVWIISSSFMVLILPAMIEIERVNMEEQQIQQQRQILLGPNAAASTQGSNARGVSSMAPLPPQSPK